MHWLNNNLFFRFFNALGWIKIQNSVPSPVLIFLSQAMRSFTILQCYVMKGTRTLLLSYTENVDLRSTSHGQTKNTAKFGKNSGDSVWQILVLQSAAFLLAQWFDS